MGRIQGEQGGVRVTDTDDIIDAILAHHGVKGQKWGVRKKYDPHPSSPSGGGTSQTNRISKNKAPQEAKDKKLLKDLAAKGITPETMHAKYGPGSMSPQKSQKSEKTNGAQKFHPLTKNQKIALAVGGAAVVAGLAYYGGVKLKGPAVHLPEGLTPEGLLKAKPTNSYGSYISRQAAQQKGLTEEGLAHLSKEEINFPVGHVFKRVTTERETKIRPEGFFAASNDADVEHYKGIMPLYWKGWGKPVDVGYVTHLEAKKAVKAPSERAMYDFLRDSIAKDPKFRAEYESHRWANKIDKKDYDTLAKKVWPKFSVDMSDTNNYTTQKYFEHLKAHGYNATLDTNDAGVLAKAPIRLLDGKAFKITQNEVIGKDVLDKAIASRDEWMKTMQ
jgi:hypothetical protein